MHQDPFPCAALDSKSLGLYQTTVNSWFVPDSSKLDRFISSKEGDKIITARMFWICIFNQSLYLKFDAQEWHTRARTNT